MAQYLKPQAPLMRGEDYVYPPTTADQVILSDGTRLEKNGKIYADTLDGLSLPEIMLMIYPVGSIYMSVNEVSPQTLFGGTWEQLKDSFLLGAGGSYPLGSTGGEEMHVMTVDEMPNHYHLIYADPNFCAVSTGDINGWKQSLVNASNHAVSDGYYDLPAGGNQPHNNMPPYLAVNMWRRVS